MKKAAVVSLICSAVVLVLLCVLFFVLMSWEDGWNFGLFHWNAGSDQDYQTGNAVFQTDDLRELQVEWISGSVRIEKYEGDTVKAYDNYEGDRENLKMRYRYQNGKLSVKFCRRRWFLGHVSNKDLTILIPERLAGQLEKVSLDNVSASVSVSGLSGGTLDLETVSGNIRAENLNFREVDLKGVSAECEFSSVSVDTLKQESVSGDFTFFGRVQSAELDAVSGNLRIDSSEMLADLRSETVSGNLDVLLPAGSVFTVQYDKVSGNFTSGFPGLSGDHSFNVENNGSENVGTFRLETVSGDMRIMPRES